MPAARGAAGAGGWVMAGVAPQAWELLRDGDSALLLAFPARLDPNVNARCVAVAEKLREQRVRGVRDVVEAFATVTVHFDPVRGDIDEISTALRRLAAGDRVGGGSRRCPIRDARSGCRCATEAHADPISPRWPGSRDAARRR